MNQNVELAKVKAKIKSMANLATSTTYENEAMNAFASIGKLLAQYNLSMADVYDTDAQYVQKFLTIKSSRGNATRQVLTAIARFCDCKVWTHGHMKTMDYNFFGLEHNVDMAIYLSELIQKSIESEWNKFKQTDTYKSSSHRVATSKSFQYGMIDRLYKRLNELKSELDQQVQEDFNKKNSIFDKAGTSLVVVRRDKLEAEYKKLNLSLRTYGQHRAGIHSYDAYSHGTSSANSVNLSRPINGSSVKLIGH